MNRGTLTIFAKFILIIGFVAGAYADPPQWAPAHGYRDKNDDGLDIVFDSGLGVYMVVDMLGVYWDDDYYYRERNNRWERSRSPESGWILIESDDVPPGLAQKGRENKGKKNN